MTVYISWLLLHGGCKKKKREMIPTSEVLESSGEIRTLSDLGKGNAWKGRNGSGKKTCSAVKLHSFAFFFFSESHLRPMEVPRLWVE